MPSLKCDDQNPMTALISYLQHRQALVLERRLQAGGLAAGLVHCGLWLRLQDDNGVDQVSVPTVEAVKQWSVQHSMSWCAACCNTETAIPVTPFPQASHLGRAGRQAEEVLHEASVQLQRLGGQLRRHHLLQRVPQDDVHVLRAHMTSM